MNNTESKTVELEIVEDQKLVKYADQTGLEKSATFALLPQKVEALAKWVESQIITGELI